MKMRALFLCLLITAISFAASSSYRVTLYQASVVSGTELQAGDYKLELKDNKAVITKGKQSIEAAVKVETSDNKFGSTSVRYENAGGKMKVSEIRLGGTRTKLVFNN
jgi:hypothetical protein